jgi:hypothetical protein
MTRLVLALRIMTFAVLLAALVAALVLVAAAALDVARPAQAQQPGTGASAAKNCPSDTALIGSTVTCNFIVANTGDFPATVTLLTETSPDPGGTAENITCTTAGGTTIATGDTLQAHTECAGTFQFTVPNDPTLCGTSLRDRVDIALSYPNFTPPLTAGAFATHTTAIVCPPTPTDTPTNTPTNTPTEVATNTPQATSTVPTGEATSTPEATSTLPVGGVTETPVTTPTTAPTTPPVVATSTSVVPQLPNTGSTPGGNRGSGLLAAVLLTTALAGTASFLRRRAFRQGR